MAQEQVTRSCGCVYRVEIVRGGRFEHIHQRCSRHTAQEEALDASESAEYERLGSRGYWR